MRRRVAPILTAVALIALGGACRDDGGTAAPPTGEVTTSTAPLPEDRTSTTVSRDTPTTSATRVDAAADLVLRGDGLGVVELGAPPDEAVAAVSAALGEPTADSGWEPSFSAYGTCPGGQVRGVEWNHLVLLFTDGDTAYGSGRHLFSWRLTGAPPALGTARGFGYGATANDAEELYPGTVEVVAPDDPFPGFLRVRVDGGTITAYLDDGDVVTNLEAGAPCGE